LVESKGCKSCPHLNVQAAITVATLIAVLSLQCSYKKGAGNESGSFTEPSLELALKEWPEMPQQIVFIGLKDCLTKFQVYWNGALSCFVGRDCFGNLFPPQRGLAGQYESDQLHMTFAGGNLPVFPVVDSGQVEQTLLEGYLPVIESKWSDGGISYSFQTLATALEPDDLDPEVTAGMTMALTRVIIEVPEDAEKEEVHLWMNFSGYRVLVPTVKEQPEDVFPLYGRRLTLDKDRIMDENHRIRAVIRDLPPGAATEFYDAFALPAEPSAALERSERKGFLKNLLHIRMPCRPGEKAMLVLAVPYFPVEPGRLDLSNRDFDTELGRVKKYWEHFYLRDAVMETPASLINNFYKSGLWRTLITADRDPGSGMVYAKSSPAWYETIWPNCAMVSAVSLDMRGHHELAESYLEPFLVWQSVREPPNMEGASRDGFLCPPSDYCAILWVSNHGNILWALCEHYRITGDPLWAERITGAVIQASEWIIEQRGSTKADEIGSGMLPGGTVSDDRGSGQYLCSDAQNYRGLRSAADFLLAIHHERAEEMDREADHYREDIRRALSKAVARTDSVVLEDGDVIPYVPAEIHQTGPPAFNKFNFWPYINYVDVGPMQLVDCHVLESSSDMARYIFGFESKFRVANLDHPISVSENWVTSVKMEGNVPAHLLHHGVSTIEPFYSPRSTMDLENDDIENYLGIFYHQLASGVSHRNLSPCENRYGVWHMPWADGEFHRMLLRMLVYEQGDELVLLMAIPRRWLENGRQIRIERQPTAYGNIGLQVDSHLKDGFIEMILDGPEQNVPGGIKIRLRHPLGYPIQKVELGGMGMDDFNEEYLFLQGALEKTVRIRAWYGFPF
jgi:hypothetical protein